MPVVALVVVDAAGCWGGHLFGVPSHCADVRVTFMQLPVRRSHGALF